MEIRIRWYGTTRIWPEVVEAVKAKVTTKLWERLGLSDGEELVFTCYNWSREGRGVTEIILAELQARGVKKVTAHINGKSVHDFLADLERDYIDMVVYVSDAVARMKRRRSSRPDPDERDIRLELEAATANAGRYVDEGLLTETEV